jgi:hypothetical protein
MTRHLQGYLSTKQYVIPVHYWLTYNISVTSQCLEHVKTDDICHSWLTFSCTFPFLPYVNLGTFHLFTCIFPLSFIYRCPRKKHLIRVSTGLSSKLCLGNAVFRMVVYIWCVLSFLHFVSIEHLFNKYLHANSCTDLLVSFGQFI